MASVMGPSFTQHLRSSLQSPYQSKVPPLSHPFLTLFLSFSCVRWCVFPTDRGPGGRPRLHHDAAGVAPLCDRRVLPDQGPVCVPAGRVLQPRWHPAHPGRQPADPGTHLPRPTNVTNRCHVESSGSTEGMCVSALCPPSLAIFLPHTPLRSFLLCPLCVPGGGAVHGLCGPDWAHRPGPTEGRVPAAPAVLRRDAGGRQSYLVLEVAL